LELRIHKWFKIYIYSDLSENCIISYHDLSFNVKENLFFLKDIIIPLTKNCKYILSIFISNKEEILAEQFLIDKIW
jgi:DNA-binding response OmpR family regulator